ncbi:MAG: NADH-quinone oxidoreductase subunit J [Planctomycetota bacterium]|nr:NADH-quinone oxidoreductase subunit J [Planctomycetota bacterium]
MMAKLPDIIFLVSALVCVASAVAIVSRKNPVYSVVYMLPLFLGMTTIFVLLQATFLAAVQMIVYGGAILVLFLFVLMLINLKPEELRDDFSLVPRVLTTLGAAMLAGVIAVFARRGSTDGLHHAFARDVDAAFGSVGSLATPLFKELVVPFELASVLIVVAIVGAVLLAKKKV